MKKPEQWKELWSVSFRDVISPQIKAIQDDAFKAGMLRAAEIARDFPPVNRSEETIQRLIGDYIAIEALK